jgi:starch phosphorylase
VRAIRRFTVRPVLPSALQALGELAGNLRWSWHPPTQDLFASIDARLWERSGHDPVTMLGLVPGARLDELAGDEDFAARLETEHTSLRKYMTEGRWYQGLGESTPRSIAYFSPEYGITAVLPQYSGGLGILAGDHLKAASDLGVPILGVGLLYRHGYFRQSLSRDGWQQERYPVLDPDELPISLLRNDDRSAAKISVGMPDGETAVARIWVAQVGRVPLLLLDTDVEENTGVLRDITDRLYGGNTEHRLRQEMLLGIGGVRAIRAYCALTGAPDPEVFHTNEGHAGFLGLERIRELTEDHGVSFDAAKEISRAGTVFTTHTPVPAGIDRFPRELVSQYFGGDNAAPGVPVDRILELGAESYDGGDPGVFNMAVMGLRLAQRANGVSQLHGQVSRGMFGGLWPAFDAEERPIASITNGVHAPTWVAREVFELAREHGVETGTGSRTQAQDVFAVADTIPGETIWAVKRRLRERLVLDARRRLRESWLARGAAPSELGWVDKVLDPDVLTIGFARRVPSYKRLTLMLRDADRLKRILLDPERPVQLVIAGKAHPADDGGKRLIQEIVKFADDPAVRHRIVFLPNYDIEMAQPLYPGCDVWLNNPLRPYEACGTSGMKAALNGGLNLSILDGWWDEWFDGNNGWAIPSADGVEDPDRRDDLESAALYDLIENEVTSRFYDHDENGVPGRWLEMVRHTLRSLGPKVLADRMVGDYVHQLYVPATEASRTLNHGFQGAKELADWKRRVSDGWSEVRVDHVDSAGVGDTPEVGVTMAVHAFVSLGQLSPADVDVQLLHGRVRDEDTLHEVQTTSLKLAESFESNRHRFDGDVRLATTGPFGYTVRVVPSNARLASVAELGLVTQPTS